jgi:hypothetical protein
MGPTAAEAGLSLRPRGEERMQFVTASGPVSSRSER